MSKSTYQRLGQKQRARVFALLVKRDGARCSICRRKGNEKTLVVDCIDNSGDHSRIDNLQLLCRSHNTSKNPRSVGRFNPTAGPPDQLESPPPSTAEMAKNQAVEAEFYHWLYQYVKVFGYLHLSDAKNGGAEHVGASPLTIMRYIAKCTSFVGKYEVVEHDETGRRIIRFKRRVALNIERDEQLDRLKDDALAGAGPS